jgi:hypothetical protein
MVEKTRINTGQRNGRHEETRTPDLYRVKAATTLHSTTYKRCRNCQYLVRACKHVFHPRALGSAFGLAPLPDELACNLRHRGSRTYGCALRGGEARVFAIEAQKLIQRIDVDIAMRYVFGSDDDRKSVTITLVSA